jgi:hypothetical protein
LFPTLDWQRQSSGQIKKRAFPAPITWSREAAARIIFAAGCA